MFKKAVRSQAKIKIAVTGPSGAGKTFSALKIAQGLGKKIAVIDSENDSASLYSHLFEFDSAVIDPPYTTEKYIAAINAAVTAGYDVVVVDSITHAWSGTGGLLQQKEALDGRGGSSFANWAKITPKHEAFMATILQSKINLIATMRSKQDYVLSDKNGRQVPTKVGLAPQQREGMEYEFTTVFDVAIDHNAAASKDRTGLFPIGEHFRITEETGSKIAAWLAGADATVPRAAAVGESADEITKEITTLADGITDGELKSKIIIATADADNNVEKLKRILARTKEVTNAVG